MKNITPATIGKTADNIKSKKITMQVSVSFNIVNHPSIIFTAQSPHTMFTVRVALTIV